MTPHRYAKLYPVSVYQYYIDQLITEILWHSISYYTLPYTRYRLFSWGFLSHTIAYDSTYTMEIAYVGSYEIWICSDDSQAAWIWLVTPEILYRYWWCQRYRLEQDEAGWSLSTSTWDTVRLSYHISHRIDALWRVLYWLSTYFSIEYLREDERVYQHECPIDWK